MRVLVVEDEARVAKALNYVVVARTGEDGTFSTRSETQLLARADGHLRSVAASLSLRGELRRGA